ncbi:hypothetical protein TNCV_3465471 [Trichonephila clavipes]|nr:hypothetical protein TNCV_3465471 [Trichonephila clavipes]
MPLDKLQKVPMGKPRALHTEEAFNGLFDFSITSKAPSGEILQSRKQMKVTWCEIRTSRIVIRKQNARSEKSRSLFPNRLFRFRKGVTVLRSIDGSSNKTLWMSQKTELNGVPTIHPSSQSETESHYHPHCNVRDVPGRPPCVAPCVSRHLSY